MAAEGHNGEAHADGAVLRWTGRVLSAADLQQTLNGHRQLVLPMRTIITPLAAEQLRTQGIAIHRHAEAQPAAEGSRWGYAQERPHAFVQSALQALEREGVALQPLAAPEGSLPCRWARAVAECVAQGKCAGGVLFCDDAGLVCCVANKVAGLRALAVHSAAQAARARLTLGANLVVVEMPGRTFFEIRQILRTVCAARSACPAGVACTLQELDGHAHR